MRRVRPACCARAASGHAAAALPTSVMNVRLLIRSSDGGISRVIPLKELLHGAWLAVLIPSPSMWLALSRHLRHTGWTFGSLRYPHHRISIASSWPTWWCMDRTTPAMVRYFRHSRHSLDGRQTRASHAQCAIPRPGFALEIIDLRRPATSGGHAVQRAWVGRAAWTIPRDISTDGKNRARLFCIAGLKLTQDSGNRSYRPGRRPWA